MVCEGDARFETISGRSIYVHAVVPGSPPDIAQDSVYDPKVRKGIYKNNIQPVLRLQLHTPSNQENPLQKGPQTPDKSGDQPQARNRQESTSAGVVVVFDDALLRDLGVDVCEAELRRVEADGVVQGREALVARLDEDDVGALLSSALFLLSHAPYPPIAHPIGHPPNGGSSQEGMGRKVRGLTANNDAPCVASSTIWIVASSPALTPKSPGTSMSGMHSVPGYGPFEGPSSCHVSTMVV